MMVKCFLIYQNILVVVANYVGPFVFYHYVDCLSSVMVSMLAWSVVFHGFEPRSGHTKDYKIVICNLSAKHAALRNKCKD